MLKVLDDIKECGSLCDKCGSFLDIVGEGYNNVDHRMWVELRCENGHKLVIDCYYASI